MCDCRRGCTISTRGKRGKGREREEGMELRAVRVAEKKRVREEESEKRNRAEIRRGDSIVPWRS